MSYRVLAVALILCSACGRIGFGENSDDGKSSEVPSADAAPDLPNLSPFAAESLVVGLGLDLSDFDRDPSLSLDGKELFFLSFRSGTYDFWTATREGPGTDFESSPVRVDALSSLSIENAPALSPNGLTMWFASTRSGAGDIWVSTRTDTASPWSTPVRDNELSSDGGGYPGGTNTDETIMLLHSSRLDGKPDLFLATRTNSSQPWGAPVPIVELNTSDWEADPHLSADGLTIVFCSDRPGGKGSLDLYEATRPNLGSPFEVVRHLDELSTPYLDQDPWLSPDRKHLIFTGYRPGPYGRTIYESTRSVVP